MVVQSQGCQRRPSRLGTKVFHTLFRVTGERWRQQGFQGRRELLQEGQLEIIRLDELGVDPGRYAKEAELGGQVLCPSRAAGAHRSDSMVS